MKCAVRYYTRSGNVKKLADAVADELGVKSLDVSAGLDEYVDVLFLGSSVYGANIDPAVKGFLTGVDPHEPPRISLPRQIPRVSRRQTERKGSRCGPPVCAQGDIIVDLHNIYVRADEIWSFLHKSAPKCVIIHKQSYFDAFSHIRVDLCLR